MLIARQSVRDLLPLVGSVCAAFAMAGCATPPAPTPTPAPERPSYEQFLKDAEAAAAAGNKEQARGLYRDAAKTSPASKEPWLKLADDYMREDNYGHAVLSAQEVLQRDPADMHAAGILTVGGLRLAAAGVQSLRQQKGTFNGEARTEAQKTAEILRELTGEKELVPVTPPTPPVAEAPAARPGPVRRAVVPAPKPAVTAAPAAGPKMPDNPFKPSR